MRNRNDLYILLSEDKLLIKSVPVSEISLTNKDFNQNNYGFFA